MTGTFSELTLIVDELKIVSSTAIMTLTYGWQFSKLKIKVTQLYSLLTPSLPVTENPTEFVLCKKWDQALDGNL